MHKVWMQTSVPSPPTLITVRTHSHAPMTMKLSGGWGFRGVCDEKELNCNCCFVSRSFATAQLWLRLSAGPSSSSVAGTQRPRSGRDLAEKRPSTVNRLERSSGEG